MSVTDHRPDHRRLGITAGAAFLTLALAGCSELGRTAQGTIAFETPRHGQIQQSNPLVTGCHRLTPGGAVELRNRTMIDMVMFESTGCTGKSNAYIATTMSDVIAPGSGPWRSYVFIH